jgi:hypothetical protein
MNVFEDSAEVLIRRVRAAGSQLRVNERGELTITPPLLDSTLIAVVQLRTAEIKALLRSGK